MPQSLIGLKQIKSGEIGSFIASVFGASETGVSSITISKDFSFEGTSNFIGPTFTVGNFEHSGEVIFKSGFSYQGAITGSGNLLQSGSSEFLGGSFFRGSVHLDSVTTSSGIFYSVNTGIFSGVTQLNGASTFNGDAFINSDVYVNASSVLTNSGQSILLGDVTLGVNSPFSSINYLIGTNHLSGQSIFKGASYFDAPVHISGDVNVNSGDFNFSGESQNFYTQTNLVGPSLISQGQANQLDVTGQLGITASAELVSSGLGYFYNDVYLSGASPTKPIFYNIYCSQEFSNSGNILLESESYIDVGSTACISFLSGSSGVFEAGSILKLEANSVQQVSSAASISINNGGKIDISQGGAINLSGNFNINSGSSALINSGAVLNMVSGGKVNLNSGAYITIASDFPSTEYGAEPGVTVPTGHLYLQKIEVNGYTYLVLAIKPYA